MKSLNQSNILYMTQINLAVLCFSSAKEIYNAQQVLGQAWHFLVMWALSRSLHRHVGLSRSLHTHVHVNLWIHATNWAMVILLKFVI